MLETFGWDLVFATTLSAFDAALQSSGKAPQAFAIQGLSGQWKSFHLVAGAPANYQRVEGVIGTGTAMVHGSAIDMAGTKVTALISLGIDASGTIIVSGTPTIDTYILPHNVPEAQYYGVVALLGTLMAAETPKIDGAFGAVALGGKVPDGGAWLVPTSAAFASTPMNADDAVCAILTMTESRDSSTLQCAVDARLFDGAPAGTDRVVAISPERVASQLVLPALTSVVQGSSLADFKLSPADTAYNAGAITWGQFSYPNDDNTTSTVSPTIPQGNAQLTLSGAVLHLSMSNVNFPYPGWPGPGHIVISFNAEQFVTLEIATRSDGQLVLAIGEDPQQSFAVTVIPDHAEQVFQLCVNAGLQVLFAVVGGALDSALGEAENAISSSVEEDGEQATVELEMQEITQLIEENANPEEVEAAEEDAAAQAGDAVAQADNPGLLQRFKSSLMSNRYKIGLKIIETVTTKIGESLTAIGVALAQRAYDRLPSINPIIDQAASAVTWPGAVSTRYAGGKIDGAIVFWVASDSTGH